MGYALQSDFSTGWPGAALVIRDADDGDMEAIQAIYAHYVMTSPATFEEVPPSLPEMKMRRANVVAAGLAERCTIQIAYAIGVAEPVSVYANTHGTGTVDNASLEAAIAECMPLTPRNIRQHLGLNRPIYAPTAAYGHFGRTAGEAGEGSFSWEAVDLADKLAASV